MLTTSKKQTNAAETYAQIAAVNEAAIQVVCRDRMIPRKEQAALARKLFKSLGIKGVSVTAPNYSMAQVVNVTLPRIETSDADFLLDGTNYRNHCWSDMPIEVPAKQKNAARWTAERKIDEILARAFPQHDDRSDSQTDYFDSCWSVN